MADRQPGDAAIEALLHDIAGDNGRTLRSLLGLLIFIGGGYPLGRYVLLLAELNPPAPIVLALKGGLLCAFDTALRTIPVLMVKIMSAHLPNVLLGFGVGVVLPATAFPLIMPALSAADDLGYPKFSAGFLVNFGLAVDVMGLFILNRLVPDVHPGCRGAPLSSDIPPHILLFVTATILHNIPEGMVVGVSADAGLDEVNGPTLGIAPQDMLEGLVMALVLTGVGMLHSGAMLVGAASDLVEPLFTMLCAWLAGLSTLLLPRGLATAAGAMPFVIAHEIILESHRQGHAAEVTLGLVFDFCPVMMLDTALGQGTHPTRAELTPTVTAGKEEPPVGGFFAVARKRLLVFVKTVVDQFD